MAKPVRKNQAPAQARRFVIDFDSLFENYWDKLCSILYTIVGDWDEAQDLALETFLQLYQRPPRHQQNLGGWLYRVGTNLALNTLRARKRRRFYEEQLINGEGEFASGDQLTLDPAESIEYIQEREHVHSVLARLKPRSAQLLILHFSGFSYRETAQVLNISAGSVGTLLARAEGEFDVVYRSSYSEFPRNDLDRDVRQEGEAQNASK